MTPQRTRFRRHGTAQSPQERGTALPAQSNCSSTATAFRRQSGHRCAGPYSACAATATANQGRARPCNNPRGSAQLGDGIRPPGPGQPSRRHFRPPFRPATSRGTSAAMPSPHGSERRPTCASGVTSLPRVPERLRGIRALSGGARRRPGVGGQCGRGSRRAGERRFRWSGGPGSRKRARQQRQERRAAEVSEAAGRRAFSWRPRRCRGREARAPLFPPRVEAWRDVRRSARPQPGGRRECGPVPSAFGGPGDGAVPCNRRLPDGSPGHREPGPDVALDSRCTVEQAVAPIGPRPADPASCAYPSSCAVGAREGRVSPHSPWDLVVAHLWPWKREEEDRGGGGVARARVCSWKWLGQVVLHVCVFCSVGVHFCFSVVFCFVCFLFVCFSWALFFGIGQRFILLLQRARCSPVVCVVLANSGSSLS